MQAEGESREGPERWHGGPLPPRSGGGFPPLLTGVEQGGGVWEFWGVKVAMWEQNGSPEKGWEGCGLIYGEGSE
jgi:hypothetical protein